MKRRSSSPHSLLGDIQSKLKPTVKDAPFDNDVSDRLQNQMEIDHELNDQMCLVSNRNLKVVLTKLETGTDSANPSDCAPVYSDSDCDPISSTGSANGNSALPASKADTGRS